VSGRCGRLKCCLRYEHEGYGELEAKLPRVGTRIHTSHGTGQVIDRQILTQLVKIRTDDNKLVTVVIEDVLERDVPAPEGDSQPHDRGREDNGRRRGRDARDRSRDDKPASADESVQQATEADLNALADESAGESLPSPEQGGDEPQDRPPGARRGRRGDRSDGPGGRRRRRGGRGRRPPGAGPTGGEGG
jgi:hypothetical protein